MSVINQVIDVLAGIIIGFTLACWFYCYQLGITSGPLYVEPLVMWVSILGTLALKWLTHLDPSFGRK
jgi:hypothetical protein